MKLIIGPMGQQWFSFLLDEKDHIVEVRTGDLSSANIGSIYVGRVEQVKKNINSAFLRIGEDRKVFLSLQDAHTFFYTHKQGKGDTPVEGDCLLVQIEKEAHKTKLAKVTSDLTLSGRYAVLTTDKKQIFVSSKIQNQDYRKVLKARLKKYVTDRYGFIIRTNAETVTFEEISEELKDLGDQFLRVTDKLDYKMPYTRVHKPMSGYLSMIRDLKLRETLAIHTCHKAMADKLEALRTIHNLDLKLIGGQDEGLEDLLNRFDIKSKVSKLYQKKVWLKSGATIVIEPTEAMTVIDVNTEKTLSKKKSSETLLRTNIEAAEAIMDQIRARNISGIIIIDFIDMVSDKDKKTLMNRLTTLADLAPVKTTVHGMTTLGLVELTRKKIEKPLWENQALQNYLKCDTID